MRNNCECADKGCKAHEGMSACHNRAKIVLYRVDMDDMTGTKFCDDCAEDAFDSGLFTEFSPEEQEMDTLVGELRDEVYNEQ
jgi:hypothetical protein